MKLPSDPAWSGSAAASQTDAGARWLLVGGDNDALTRLALMLARFEVDAQPFAGDPAAARHRCVLCDVCTPDTARLWTRDLVQRSAPLLALGAETGDMRAGLIAAGAVDAVSARIGTAELAARIKAAGRLHQLMRGQVRLAGFTFDTGLRHVRWQDTALPLMPREFDLLLVLARQPGIAIARDDLLRQVWRTEFDPGTNSVEVHICKLRRNLSALRGRVWIETVRNRGYRLAFASTSKG